MKPQPQPPPLPGQKNLRLASALNLFLPGAGLFYLGWRWAGALMAAGFLGCFGVALTLFLTGYVRYLSIALGGELLESGKLEEAAAGLHQGWLASLAVAGGVLYLCSGFMFVAAKRQYLSGAQSR